ncbi:MAG: polysaccharide deacetylase family protein [Candidatus Altiarchaeota archaeon]|nr:polysaccharide deacetylase family protein [Candidatus Altiarchaeota archaeon]
MILTVDVEKDWGDDTINNFIFLDGLFNWLDDTKSSATLFVVGDVAEKLQEKGIPKTVEIASHSMTHTNLKTLTENDLLDEIQESKAILELTFKKKIKGFRAPYFTAPDNLWELLSHTGYSYSSSLVAGWFPGRYYNRIKPHPFEKGGIKEMPIQSFRFVPIAFGLPFFRLFWPLSKLIVPKNPYIFYYHPTELLPTSPGPNEKILTRFIYGLHKGRRARRLLYEVLGKAGTTQSIEDYLSTQISLA